MAYTLTSAAAAARSPEVVRAEILAHIATPLPADSTATMPLKLGVLALLREFQTIVAASPSLQAEFDVLKARVSAWSQGSTRVSAAAATVAARALPTAATTARATSSTFTVTILEEEDLHRLRDAINSKTQLLYGSDIEEIFIFYMIRISVLYAYEWQDPITKLPHLGCIRQLEALMIALNNSDPVKKKEKLCDCLAFMCKELQRRDDHNLVITYGLQMALAGKLDFFSGPPVSVGPVPHAAATAAAVEAGREAVMDIASLTRSFETGCQATRYLADVTYALGTLGSSLDYELDQANANLGRRFADKKGIKREKRDGIAAFVARHPTYKKMPAEHRIGTYIKFCSFFNGLTEPEASLHDLNSQFRSFMDASKGLAGTIKSKLEAAERAKTPLEKQALLFKLSIEHEEDILQFRQQMLCYLQELILAMAEADVSRELAAYATLHAHDPETNYGDVAERGFRSVILEYKDRNPVPNYAILPEEVRPTVEIAFIGLEKSKKARAALTRMHNELSRTSEMIERRYMPDFMRMRELQRAGLIAMGEDGLTPVFTMPVPIPPRAEVVVVEDRAASAAAVASPSPSSAEVASAPSVKAALIAGRPPAAEFCRALQEILPESFFTVEAAKDAYANALHYVEALYFLMRQSEGPELSSDAVAHLQMDIGLAAFHALEQLLTAQILQKANPERAAGGAGAKEEVPSIFEMVGHSLIRRLLQAHIREPEGVRVLLRNTEGMELAIRDLSRKYKIPPLLQNTAKLLGLGERRDGLSEGEYGKTLSYGEESLQVFVSLLTAISAKRGASTVDLSSYLDTSRVSMRRPAAGGAGSVAAETSSYRKMTAAGGAGTGAKKAASVVSTTVPFADNIAAAASVIQTALEKSTTYESAMLRKLTIDHNLNRLHHLQICLSDAANLELFPFYVNQARFILRTIMEEFLCAAYENTNEAIEQRDLAHDLFRLASTLGLPSLSAAESDFLRRAAADRNEARYGYKKRAHAPVTGARVITAAREVEPTTAAAVDPEVAEGFELALGSSYTAMMRGLDREIDTVLSLCRTVSNHSFKDMEGGASGKKKKK